MYAIFTHTKKDRLNICFFSSVELTFRSCLLYCELKIAIVVEENGRQV